MERRNETLIKLAQTGLMAALCFVTFTFLQIKNSTAGRRSHVFPCRKCILCAGSPDPGADGTEVLPARLGWELQT